MDSLKILFFQQNQQDKRLQKSLLCNWLPAETALKKDLWIYSEGQDWLTKYHKYTQIIIATVPKFYSAYFRRKEIMRKEVRYRKVSG